MPFVPRGEGDKMCILAIVYMPSIRDQRAAKMDLRGEWLYKEVRGTEDTAGGPNQVGAVVMFLDREIGLHFLEPTFSGYRRHVYMHWLERVPSGRSQLIPRFLRNEDNRRGYSSLFYQHLCQTMSTHHLGQPCKD